MQRILRPTAVLAALFMAGALTIVPASSETPSPTPEPSPTLAAETPSPAASPSDTPSPSPEPEQAPESSGWSPPAGYTGSFRPDMTVMISGTDSCLNARVQPGLTIQSNGDPVPVPVPVFNCLPDGFTGKLAATEWTTGTPPPVPADGHWWWYLLGQGWVAEDWLVAAAPSATAAGAGLIAFTRVDGIWLMSADGTDQHHIHSVDLNNASINTLAWSPDGSMLAVAVESWATSLAQVTRILDLDGTVVEEYQRLSRPAWSPDGRSLAGLHADPQGSTGGYWFAPVIVDRASGTETIVGPHGGNEGPVWAPDSQSVAFICISSSWEYQAPGGGTETFSTVCEGGDGLRFAPVSGGSPRVILPVANSNNAYYSRPSWSPAGDVIALLALGPAAGCSGYALVNATSGAITECFAIPDNGSLNFGCGGGPAVGPSDWSGDGRLLAYHSQSAWGDNGIVIVDIDTGDETIVPSLYAYTVDFAPDGLDIVFGADNQVWTAGVDGSGPAHLAEGNMPAWQPVP